MAGWRTAAVAAACGLLVAAAGCGSSTGVSEDATVTAYVEAPLCTAAKQELVKHGGRAGDLRVQAICLASPHEAKKLNLATLGANARRATEDSTTRGLPGSSRPKGVAVHPPDLGNRRSPLDLRRLRAAAMAHLLKLLESADSGSLRERSVKTCTSPRRSWCPSPRGSCSSFTKLHQRSAARRPLGEGHRLLPAPARADLPAPRPDLDA